MKPERRAGDDAQHADQIVASCDVRALVHEDRLELVVVERVAASGRKDDDRTADAEDCRRFGDRGAYEINMLTTAAAAPGPTHRLVPPIRSPPCTRERAPT